MTTAELYTKGARVWIPDPEEVWRGAQLLEDYQAQKKIQIEYEDGAKKRLVVTTISIPDKSKLPPLRNPEILIGENDLTSLSYLHEPAVLYNLQVRFCERNAIYTYCGIVLVAINPYEQLPIYGNETIMAYSGQDMGSMDPHIYAVAEEAFKKMSQFDENQSIIVSGESGAGKTVSAKYAMRYFATVGGAQAETQIEKKVLASNPIMEAIGNAKTIRNDNSSRFGKYIGIGFNERNYIIGANMRTYLLEKSRVVFQAADERNYHIFYQLCACSEMPEFEELKLNHPDVFYYTNQGENPYIDGVDDAEEMMNTKDAFSLLGINDNYQRQICRILSGILHMGNIKFHDNEDDTCQVPKGDRHYPIMAEMLGIDADQMRNWLCNRKIVTTNEVLVKPLSLTQAYFARDALSKHIYSFLFSWIVEELNKVLTSTTKEAKFIGVLDIYGFETFEINSFEQFCINFANEKLQQQFCMHVFKLEQEEYVREEIEWSFIDFYDNQPCIDLIESRLGILDLLDEECKMPRGSDKNWCQKLYDKHTKHSHFSKPRMANDAFIIHHFADDVEYHMDGFLEKNRDTVIEEHINILKASQYELVAELFSERSESDRQGSKKGGRGPVVRAAKEQPRGNKKANKKTVGSQFRDSLTNLMDTLNATTPHYVRCIKPNDQKMAFLFEPKRAVQQLRACGVLETIRISAAGYPSRWTYPEFFHRYRVLARSKEVKRNDIKKTCENILNKLIDDSDKYQFGKTKIFFRAGQVAYLEKLRSDRLRACGVMIQKHVKGWLSRRRYQKIRRTVMLVQRFGRGMLARRHALFLKRTAAVTKIQAHARGYLTRARFLQTRTFVVKLQAYCRGLLARRNHVDMLRNAKAKVIQKFARGYLVRQRYQRVLRGIIKLQSHVRRRRAKKELKQLKIEARSVEHIKTVAKGLENKIITMQQKLDERNVEIKTMREKEIHMNELKNEVEKLRVVKSSVKIAESKVNEQEELIAQLREELMREKGEKEAAVSMKEKVVRESEEVINTLRKEKTEYKEELNRLNALLKTQGEDSGDNTNKKVEEMRQSMLQEFESERSHHQKLVKDYARLQQRLENLQGDMQLLSPPSVAPSHKRSASGLSNISLESETSSSTADQGGSPPGLTNDEEGRRIKSPVYSYPGPVDVGLMTRLQNKIKDLEKDRSRLQRELERKGFRHAEEMNESDIYDTIKLQEMEIDNSKLKTEILQLRQATADLAVDTEKGKPTTQAGQEFIAQFEAMLEELARRREECLQLRTLLSARSRELSQLASENYGNNPAIVNEDGELEMAYRTQKDLNRLLEDQLQQNQKKSELREKELRQQMEELKADNDRQQKLIGQNLTLTPEARIEATMQHEITRLTSENLDLRELNDKQIEQIKKLKKALKIYAKRLKASEGQWQRGFFSKSMSIASDVAAELEKEIQADETMPAVKQIREREWMGMYEYRKEDEGLLIRSLITELKPRMANIALPGLPAYIMFMCIRHTDYQNDDEKVRSFLTNGINGIKKIVKKRQEDIDTVTLWLANTCRLLHCLKQYSGEKSFQKENTPKQNEHCLRNFDLSEYRQILSDLAVWVYQGLIKLMESNIQPMIVAAVLEHEAIAGLSGSKPTGLRGRLSSTTRQGGDRSKDYSVDSLIKSLSNFLRVLNNHGVDPELVNQVFRQLFYFICAGALNNLLLRKDMCHWSKGMQIRYNISHLEQWLRDNRLVDCGAAQNLEPIVQASQLLQARKTDTDVDSIVEMCSKLSTSQIIKILNLYTPVNEFEERVPISFIRKIQQKLSTRENNTQQLLMDTKLAFPVTFPFNPSSLSLETITIPTEWNVNCLKRV